MDYLIMGGDARMAALAELLRERGREARHVSEARAARAMLPLARRIVTQCPGKLGLSTEALLDMAPQVARIYLCGPGRYEGDGRVVDLWGDEQLLRENALLTAEGAISAAMCAARRCLLGMPCAVIGWGRIGRALAGMLVALGAGVTVVTRSEAHAAQARGAGAQAALTEALPEVLAESLLVFSTPPVMVLDEAMLNHVHLEAMVIDLASPPYGVDLMAAWRLKLRAWREPGLPGRYCPRSAAEVLFNAMERSDASHD